MPEPFGPAEFAAAADVSRETLNRLEAYVALLVEWNARQNLVSKSSLEDVWRRHVWDSAQLVPLLPKSTKTLIDLGSGAGFPALVLAALRPGIRITLVDSIAKKCRFLAEAARGLQVDVDIRNTRIEAGPREGFDAVTARACAPMDLLLGYACRFQKPDTVNFFLKGQDVEAELKKATISWKMEVLRHSSRSGSGTILEIRKLAHVQSGRPFVPA
ncbi:MAG TPA: 16S rRNA (guanine(527)-N(7))-methyltransferase RsmG [Rhizomicrobium sp.]|nr:16S rRNA (guanine(527)-N(7))-methyltransferase RsmG [Rhizomicrobium sp.]